MKKVVVITGATDGIGRALAKLLSKEYNLALCGRNAEKMEQLLSECDELDNKILRLALAGQAYEDIAEHCFVNVSTVKYRMRKMIGICQTENRAELLRLVEKYLPQLT